LTGAVKFKLKEVKCIRRDVTLRILRRRRRKVYKIMHSKKFEAFSLSVEGLKGYSEEFHYVSHDI